MNEDLTDIEKVCRTCGGRTLTTVLLFKAQSNYSNEVVSSDVINLLSSLRLKIERGDGLPQQICISCLEILLKIDEFSKKCQRVQEIFLTLLPNILYMEDVEIKDEYYGTSVDPLEIENEISQSGVQAYKQENDVFPAEADLDSSNDDGLANQWQLKYSAFCGTTKSKLKKRCKQNVSKPGIKTECKFCKGMFQNLVNHQRNCTKKKAAACKYCDIEIANSADLNQHMDEKHSDKFPACCFCLLKFDDFSKMRMHRTAVHERIQCEICDQDFPNRQSKNAHKRRKHGETISKVCPVCQKEFSTQSKYDYHIKTHDSTKLKYKCQYCEKLFYQSSHCKNHELTHTNERPHLCDVCGRDYKRRDLLLNHRNTHFDSQLDPKEEVVRKKKTPKVKLCPEPGCEKTFKQLDGLRAHLATSHLRNNLGEKIYPFNCTICSKGFMGANGLAFHIKCHEGNRQYKCQTCGTEFKLSHQLHRHIQTSHKKEKNFICSHCNKGFALKSQLNTHLITHTDEKKYQCPDCPAKFKINRYLRNHQRIHTGEKSYVCMICQKSFYSCSRLYEVNGFHTDAIAIIGDHVCISCPRRNGSQRSKRYHHERKVCHRNRKFDCYIDHSPHSFARVWKHPFECMCCKRQCHHIKHHTESEREQMGKQIMKSLEKETTFDRLLEDTSHASHDCNK